MSKTRLCLLAVSLAAALVTPTARADEVYMAAGVGPQPVSFDVFYQQLSPYGAWVQCEPYGWIWMPSGVAAGWQPYSTGYWSYSSSWGYTWYADEVWGWAPFHYGNWILTPAYGWAWVPGYTWGPAWVSWRYGAGFVAWAPLGPRYYGGGYGYGHGYGNGYGHNHQAPVQPDVRNGARDAIDPKRYVVVPESSFAGGAPVSTAMRREINDGDLNRMQAVERLPQLHAAAQAPGANGTSSARAAGRLDDSPGARDIARIDRGDLGSGGQQLESSRARELGRANDLDSGRVRDIGRIDQTRTPLPRLAPTPRLPSSGGSNDRVYQSPAHVQPIQPDRGPRAMPSSTPSYQPRSMPSSMPSYQPRSMPSSPRSMPNPSYRSAPRSNVPVMRTAPAARPIFHGMPGRRPR